MLKISKPSHRIQIISEKILLGSELWDLCCDHGYVGKSFLNKHPQATVHFVDQVPDIISNLKKEFKSHSYNCHFHENSIFNLVKEMSGTVVLAGVGSFKICDFLRKYNELNNRYVNRFILGHQQPIDIEKEYLNILVDYNLNEKIKITENGRTRFIYIFDQNLNS